MSTTHCTGFTSRVPVSPMLAVPCWLSSPFFSVLLDAAYYYCMIDCTPPQAPPPTCRTRSSFVAEGSVPPLDYNFFLYFWRTCPSGSAVPTSILDFFVVNMSCSCQLFFFFLLFSAHMSQRSNSKYLVPPFWLSICRRTCPWGPTTLTSLLA